MNLPLLTGSEARGRLAIAHVLAMIVVVVVYGIAYGLAILFH